MGKVKDLTGLRVGRLTVIERAVGDFRRPYWVCMCDCGNQKVVCGGILATKNPTRSCGCLVKEMNGPRFKTHGLSRTPASKSWSAMKARCTQPAHVAYKNYGGRGITYCKQWESFDEFYCDMGPRPPGTSLDRIDNDKGYFKENCRWATRSEQARNKRRSNKTVTAKGSKYD